MNLLIVDDQPNVVSSLALSINWSQLGIKKVYTASSALLAKNILKKNDVDILLTDIEMPIESGLSLIEWVREEGLNVACILISAHADFVYAKHAIALKVTEYIVQPARDEDIIKAVQKAINLRKSEKNVQQVLNELSFSVKEQNIAAERFFEKWPDPSSLAFSEELKAKINRINALDISCDKDSTVYVLVTRINAWHAIPLDCYDFVSQYKRILQKTMAYIGGKPLSYTVSDSIFATILILDHDDEKIKDYFSMLQESILDELSCSICIFYNKTDFIYLGDVLTRMLQDDELTKTTSSSTVMQYDYQPFRKKHQSPGLRLYYYQILAYIDKHIEEQINRSEIADFIHVSPDYIGHIVRENAGITSKELITVKKMAYAKKLLETTSLQIGEVAEKCGYDSFAYFSKIYKAVNKQSPSETRQNPSRS